MEEENPHGALDAIDGGGHVCVGLFDQHSGRIRRGYENYHLTCRLLNNWYSMKVLPLKKLTQVMR